MTGIKNGVSRVFFTPEKFINGDYFGNTLKIKVEHNGRELYENIDYVVLESGGTGTGYDAISLISIIPNYHSILYADYAVPI